MSNYLLGKEPIPFDLLYWNADATRMPAAMHSFYLRNMYHENRLSHPDGISLKGVPIDLRLIETPTFLLSTRRITLRRGVRPMRRHRSMAGRSRSCFRRPATSPA